MDSMFKFLISWPVRRHGGGKRGLGGINNAAGTTSKCSFLTDMLISMYTHVLVYFSLISEALQSPANSPASAYQMDLVKADRNHAS
jgi:hypothetical protein